MKHLKILIILLFVLMSCLNCFATENNSIYKHWGNYNIATVDGLRIYYPDKIKDSIPRIITSFSKIRERVLDNFPNEKNYVATIILDDHDDIIDSTADSKFDLINLSIFDEMDVLSARSYSLEKRFALSLAKTLVKRSTSNVSFEWRRSLAMLSIPQWFIEGMALNYAFPIDSIHYSRLLDMARYGRLYSLNDLNSLSNKPMLIKEEMLFQVHSMLSFWESTYKKGADVELVRAIVRNYKGFENTFKKYYGVSLKEAFNSYVQYVSKQSIDFESFSDPDFLDVDYLRNENKIFRSYIRISQKERIWVSSKRYTTENYDLYYKNGIEKPRILLKNVHPILVYDYKNKEIIIGKYEVNGHREKRLSLYAVDLEGKSRCLSKGNGSFKPLAIGKNRVYYTCVNSGIVKIKSMAVDKADSEKEELNLGAAIRPLDLALDLSKNMLYYTFQTVTFQTHLVAVPLNSSDLKNDSVILFSYDGDIRALKVFDGKLWCACDRDHSTTQLFCYDSESKQLKKYSSLSGGVWDINFSDNEKKRLEVSTLYRGGFSIASIPITEEPLEILYEVPKLSSVDEEILNVSNSRYRTEFHDNLWKPVLGKDPKGSVIGIKSSRSDRLDRTGIMVAPTYGLKSSDWGYTSLFKKRLDLLNVSISLDDVTQQKSYMETDYYERNRSNKLKFDYPLDLDKDLSFGFDLVERTIAKVKKNPRNQLPTAGKDHYFFVNMNQKSIRTEPYSDIFPRKGRTVELSYKRGTDTLFGGDMLYDSMSLKWDEYVPLNDYYVLTLSSWIAEDDKRNGVKRPEDLFLGSDKYLSAYDSAYKSGDRLRYASVNIARPINVDLPEQIGWLKNEFSALGVFWEMGDTRNEGKFDYDYDRGVELSSSLLVFKRLPIAFKAGYAIRNGQDGHDTYCSFSMENLEEIIK